MFGQDDDGFGSDGCARLAHREVVVDRLALSAETYERLFRAPPDPGAGTDPELMAILRKVIFGEVFHIGGLDDRTRELITVVVLATMQTLPQLRSHVGAALDGADTQLQPHAAGNLKVGNTLDRQIAAMIHCLPYIGFPRTLNAVRAI